MKENNVSAEALLYQSIGQLSIRFAHLEEILNELLAQLITQQKIDYVIGRVLIEDFSMAKTMEYLRKMLRHEWQLELELKQTLIAIDSVRQERNSFIHGFWKEPKINMETKEIEIRCGTKKIKYSDNSEKREWVYNHHKTYTISNIQTCIQKVDTIISTIQIVLNKIDEEGFDH